MIYSSSVTVVWIYAEIMLLSFKPVLDWTRIRSRNESHQSSGSDPTGQKGEGARVRSSLRERNASPPRVCYAGIICCHIEIMPLLYDVQTQAKQWHNIKRTPLCLALCFMVIQEEFEMQHQKACLNFLLSLGETNGNWVMCLLDAFFVVALHFLYSSYFYFT